MKKFNYLGLLFMGFLSLIHSHGQQLPLALNPGKSHINFQSQRGVPISNTLNDPEGSDGRAPGPVPGPLGTLGQFQGWESFGSTSPRVTRATNETGQVLLVGRRSRVGQTMVGSSFSFLFGEIIPPPDTDEYGVSLSRHNPTGDRPPTDPTTYWIPKPYDGTGFYWSTHAEAVYATQPGPVTLVWRKAQPSLPIGSPQKVGTVVDGSGTYTLLTNEVQISASPIKPPKRMYWTEGPFAQLGRPINIPTDRIKDIHIVYNNQFPQFSPLEFPFDGTKSGTIAITNTLWFNRTLNSLRAYNIQDSRVFVEFLGDKRGQANGQAIHQQLGYEIVEVIQRPSAGDVSIELGEPLTPFQGEPPADTPTLFADPVLNLGQQFVYRHSIAGTSEFDYFAIRETRNQDDYQMHWMEEGIQGLRWPYRYSRYQMVWPDDVSKYSHYIRPRVSTEAEARETAVSLPAQNAPQIAYQDPLDQPRGKLTETFAYYTWLTPQRPAHRALLQFNAGEYVRFERVFSWLDEALRNLIPNEATSLSTDFNSQPNGAASFGDAYVSDGVLHLTDALTDQNSLWIAENPSNQDPVINFLANFHLRIGGSSSPNPGYGFSFNFGTLPNETFSLPNTAELGTSDGLSVSFVVDPNHQVHSTIRFNGSALQTASVGPVMDGFMPVEIILHSGDLLDVSYQGAKILANVQTGYTPRTGRFGLAARTGTIENQAHWIDDFSLSINQGTFQSNPSLADSVASQLISWRPNLNGFDWPNTSDRPRVVNTTAFVGNRLKAPVGEHGSGLDNSYLAGYIRASEGDTYHPTAYINPFVQGFDLANQGAIIPVNAIPGKNQIEVWWFRTNQADPTRGFTPILWPSVIARYTTAWPANTSTIILASNDGSGPLASLEAKGKIYYQNDASQPGFNPNEEHALMQGGQAWSLRDDLNITTPGESYSSAPFVLLEYTEADGKTAIRLFQVVRELGDITFEYEKPAAQILQPPMPLPLLGVAFAPKIPGTPRKGLNEELVAWNILTSQQDDSDPNTWTLTTDDAHGFLPYWSLALQDAQVNPPTTRWFFATTVTDTTLDGVLSTHRPVSLGSLARTLGEPPNPQTFVYPILEQITSTTFPLGKAILAWPSLDYSMTVEVVTCPDCSPDEVAIQYSELTDEDQEALESGAQTILASSTSDSSDMTFDNWRLAWNELPQSLSDPDHQKLYSSATLTDRKGNVWVYRGPHHQDRPESFSMRFYYNTLPGFYFPSLSHQDQPPPGTATPYLRIKNINGGFVGDPVFGNADADQDNDKNALPITYHPYWPGDAPVLQMAETLTTAKRGLPAVRGQSSLQVLYQQSQFEIIQDELIFNPANTSVVLHDPTGHKKVEFNLDEMPASIRTETSRGKIWFPNLPPHLVKRFWLDPNEGVNGKLVFSGEFVDAPLGDKYVLLNVAGPQDTITLRDLVLDTDPKKDLWYTAIHSLSMDLEKFVENPAVPGTYIPLPSATTTIGLDEVAEVKDDDVAVDSYALTAIGPATGYVTLIAGNGLAATPEGEPVSMEVIRVVPDLYRGEVTVIESDNPLNEQLTLQQIVDLAGHAEDYTFEWRITSPVDGQPPATYTRDTWLANPAPWSHLAYPLSSDQAATIQRVAPERLSQDIGTFVTPVNVIPFASVTQEGDLFRFTLNTSQHHLARGNQLVLESVEGVQVFVTVHQIPRSNPSQVLVSIDPHQTSSLSASQILRLSERILPNQPQSIAFTSFKVNPDDDLTEAWISVTLAEGLAARIYLNGALVASTGFPDVQANSLPENPPNLLTTPRLQRSFRLPASALAGGIETTDGDQIHRLAAELFAPSLPGALLDFQIRFEAIKSEDQVVSGRDWIPLDEDSFKDGVRAVIGGTANVRSLSDNYLTMRYRPKTVDNGWSQWTEPQLAEGWIKRVLKGINPFNQRITDLYNNAVNTDVSILTQAGQRWEGNIALNLDAINGYGLIEIYETVLNRGKNLSIKADINYGPANDALLLAVGYINDLYMLVGNEAAADAANPTIGIGTADNTYGDFATALFSFKGQMPSLLAEELGLLRGRDDFLVPGVETRPLYNRLPWNYTRGIDSGEVIYALNYNIIDQNTDGKVDALDALKLYPQGHGDAYGHYLTALKGYYELLLNPNFDWVPRTEAVTILGKPVTVDYQDERKFAAAAGALARTGRQIFDLTWRQDYQAGTGQGWEHFRSTRTSDKGRTRHWGLDHWASRTVQGAYLNWITGNAILPYQDPDPEHADTIQQVDRKSVPELKELPSLIESLQTAMDNAESGLTPLNLPEDSVPFDLNPNGVVGGEGNTHFEQIYSRARSALNNALIAFNDAKDVTRLMRSEEDSLADLRTAVGKQELAYTNALIELFGTPYPEDIGPGKTYRTGFAGPDEIHYMYIDNVELNFNGLLDPESDITWQIDTQTFTSDWLSPNGISDFNFIQRARNFPVDGIGSQDSWSTNTTLFVEYNLSSHGFFKKPDSWVGRRASPGKLQQAISDIVKARNAAFSAFYWADAAKYDLDWALLQFEMKKASYEKIRAFQAGIVSADTLLETTKGAAEIVDKYLELAAEAVENAAKALAEATPKSQIIGTSNGGDLFAGLRAAVQASSAIQKATADGKRVASFAVIKALELANAATDRMIEFNGIAPEEWNQELREATSEIRDNVYGMNNEFMTINARLQELDDAQRHYRTLLAEADRIQAEREIFRQRTAAIIQGYRTRDAAFRIFRNEKLERYKSLFDLAAQYTFMAAKAYDYETGLLGTNLGREFINRIVNSRALGVLHNGEPQFAGSSNGDPGLSSVLAEMHGDWSVIKSRLGYNNPDAYGTTASLSYENFRILNNEIRWKDVLNSARKANLLDDPDVRRYCLQIDDGTGLPVPGLILEFSTTIGDGLNLFGHPLSPGDHKFSASSFATKIFAAGVALEGYVGMDNPSANSTAIASAGATSPSDPDLAFLNADALSANPYIYLIPVGLDSMRSPPLGDQSDVRTWNINDVAIPLPFNIGGSGFSSLPFWQSADSLTEPPFTLRKHQAFRPVSTANVFSPSIYTTTGGLQRTQFTNSRLIGRSVWNSKWKIVIPGRELLHDPNEGINRFLRTVTDIKLHFVTYSYSGN